MDDSKNFQVMEPEKMKISLSLAPTSEMDGGIVLMQLWKTCGHASKKHTTTNTTDR